VVVRVEEFYFLTNRGRRIVSVLFFNRKSCIHITSFKFGKRRNIESDAWLETRVVSSEICSNLSRNLLIFFTLYI